MIRFIIAIIAIFAQTTNVETNEIVEYKYMQFYDVRDSTNEFENLRITYHLCSLNNDTKIAIEKCQQHAFDIATSIDA